MIWIHALAVFLGAWLTFQIQPIIAKTILPEFGGLAIVWTASLLFFQAMLLAGYAYAHILVRLFTPRKCWYIHLGILLLSAWWLPPRAIIEPSFLSGGPLSWSVVITLAQSVGVPFLVVAGSGPLLQWWWSQRAERHAPYRLYAASNLGSLLGLLSFPVVFESIAGLSTNGLMWTASYVGFLVTCGLCRPLPTAGGSNSLDAEPGFDPLFPLTRPVAVGSVTAVSHVGWALVSWLVWSALGCGMLMSVTNLLCQEVASFPFLWVAPLALYLMSYILVFGWPSIYRRPLWLFAYLMAALGSLVVYLLGTSAALVWQLIGFGGVCFVGAMVCHGELYATRPNKNHLTLFYMMIAAGGLMGGIVVVAVCPQILSGFYEFQGFASAIALLAMSCSVAARVQRTSRLDWVAGMWLFGTLTVVIFLLGSTFPQVRLAPGVKLLFQGRSEYGLVAVYQTPTYLEVVSGQTGHGRQYLELPRGLEPVDYYDHDSGAGRAVLAMRALRQQESSESAKLRIGVIGLGGGCLATWTESGDEIVFYEINPQMKEIAENWFTYLSNSPGTSSVRLGDGRKLLENESKDAASEPFDILFIDAFTSDSIPVHLLTRECRDLYWDRVRPDGIVAFHITNRFVDLAPIVYDEQGRYGRQALLIDRTDMSGPSISSKWVLVTSNPVLLDSRWLEGAADAWPLGIRAMEWTDDFSSVFWLVDWTPWIDWTGITRRRDR